MTGRHCRLFLLATILPAAAPASALTMAEVVGRALESYPSLKVSQARVQSAAAAIQLARTAYLPSVDATAGINRATRNNVFGLLFPPQVFAPISGPVLHTNTLASAWGSTVGILVAWEPFDFGSRAAQVAAAEAAKARAGAGVERERLDLAALAADSFLTVIAAQQAVTAAEAAVGRSRELQRITDALVQAELRAAAESSLARAEQAAADAQLIRARQAVAEAKAALAALMGAEPETFDAAAGRLLQAPGAMGPPSGLEASPAAVEQNAAVAETEARLKVLDRSYYPRFSLQGTSYARGSGAVADGRLLGGASGLGPNIHNWGAGLSATFPLLELPSLRARRHAEEGNLAAEKARYQQTLRELKARRDRAMAAYRGAQEVAATTPVAVEAARAAVAQARARFEAGLGTALEVADAQRRLAQAEIDDGLARLMIWRAKLAAYAAQGDITPVLAEASR